MSQGKRQRHLRERHTGLARDARQLLDHVELALIAGSRQVEPRPQDRIVLAPLPFYEACPGIVWDRGIAPVFPVSHPPFNGLHASSPMPKCCTAGRTSSSMPRTKMEYGEVSVTKRLRPRCALIECACAWYHAGNIEQPK